MGLFLIILAVVAFIISVGFFKFLSNWMRDGLVIAFGKTLAGIFQVLIWVLKICVFLAIFAALIVGAIYLFLLLQ